jgi:hypothetical protein
VKLLIWESIIADDSVDEWLLLEKWLRNGEYTQIVIFRWIGSRSPQDDASFALTHKGNFSIFSFKKQRFITNVNQFLAMNDKI